MPFVNVEKALWTSKYAVGNETIDSQHRELFGLFNKLVDNVFISDVTAINVEDVLEKLVDYVEVHFSDEEAIWKKDDAIYQKQHKAHYLFVKMVMTSTKHDAKKRDVTPDVLGFIRGWLVEHIMKMDLDDYQSLVERGLIETS